MRGQPWALAAVGLVPLFFLVFTGVFTDAPSGLLHPERLVSYALVLASYGLLCWGGLALGATWKEAALALGVPVAALLVLYVAREPGTAVLSLMYTLVVALGVTAGWGADPGVRRLRAE